MSASKDFDLAIIRSQQREITALKARIDELETAELERMENES